MMAVKYSKANKNIYLNAKYYLSKRAERLIITYLNVYAHINIYLKHFLYSQRVSRKKTGKWLLSQQEPIARKTTAQAQQVDISRVIRTRTMVLFSVPNARNTSGSCCSPAEQKCIESVLYIWNRMNL